MTEQHTILITGATDGLGRALATELAATGATLLLHGRDDARGQETIEDIPDPHGSRSARVAPGRLRVAGRGSRPGEPDQGGARPASTCSSTTPASVRPSQATATAWKAATDTSFGSRSNYLAPFLLTRLLEPLLVKIGAGACGQRQLGRAGARSTSTT